MAGLSPWLGGSLGRSHRWGLGCVADGAAGGRGGPLRGTGAAAVTDPGWGEWTRQQIVSGDVGDMILAAEAITDCHPYGDACSGRCLLLDECSIWSRRRGRERSKVVRTV